MKRRSILHVDMDAFFASIAQRDNPALRGKPVIVGGHSIQRGVVASASYEARAFGVRSAMPLYKAVELCPHAVRVPVDMEAYRVANHQLRAIWGRFSPVVAPVSFDEAYLDMTGTEDLLGPAAQVAHALRAAILAETRLSCSVGGGSSKLLAKIASKAAKPAGVCVVPDGQEAAWLHPKDVSVIPGVGPKTRDRLYLLGIKTVGQLSELPLDLLMTHFGQHGADLHAIARGLDPHPVAPPGPPKSIGSEETFDADSADRAHLHRRLLRVANEIGYRLRQQELLAATITVKIRFARTFQTLERSTTLVVPTDSDATIHQTACELLRVAWDGQKPLRLIGASLSNFQPNTQLTLFGASTRQEDRRLYQAMDGLRERFGTHVIQRGTLLRRRKESG
jgi:DNA polymerase-4